ncbi:Rho protein GDP-dissociation inhibitor [Parasponia andersonii]|uniref:Rho protein GDP-dissociation inhibitor n=1 Tax=Parasponia andersonii TaxID=3476 RepID=A0A2P5ADZ4_PARAD|nr:Rho protein GDP-dissociation inhibitor [Parasponia andersonii]
MEGGKGGAEAGPSSGTGSSSNHEEMSEKPSGVCELGREEEEEEEEEDDGVDESKGDESTVSGSFVPGPLVSLKDQIEKDKDDYSLRRWKEKLLGSLESDLNGQMEPEVKFQSIGIISDDFGEINTSLPVNENQSNNFRFTLREGSHYRLKLTFSVLHNIVSGLIYSNTVWKGGVKVDESKGMLGTFAPNPEPYVHTLEEETTPSGVLARGLYSAKFKFEDDDRRCHMELKYTFEIKKR